MDFEERLRKLDVLDIGLLKLTMIAFAFFIVAFSPEVANWIQSTNYLVFLAISILAAARPVYRFYIEK